MQQISSKQIPHLSVSLLLIYSHRLRHRIVHFLSAAILSTLIPFVIEIILAPSKYSLLPPIPPSL